MIVERVYKLLELIIKDYLKLGTPISSQYLYEKYHLKTSPATIRNDMQELENLKLIEKAHYAGGRIPTNKAYKWYLEEYANRDVDIKLLKDKLKNIFKKKDINIEFALEEAMRLINETTNTISLSKTDSKSILLKAINLYKIVENKVLILFVLSDGSVINNETIINSISFKNLETIINIFSNRLKGTRIENLFEYIESIKSLILIELKDLSEKYYEIVNVIFNRLLFNNYKFYGINNLVSTNFPKSFETANKLLKMIENQTIWDLLKNSSENSVDYGNTKVILELNDEHLKNISVITKQLSAGNVNKSLTFIGPKHQDHSYLVRLLQELEQNLKSFFKGGED